MHHFSLLVLACTVMAVSSWSLPYYPVPREPMRIRYARYARPPVQPLHRIPILQEADNTQYPRPKRNYHDDDYHHDDDHKSTAGVTGPVHTFVKTDKNANYKWGVRHHVGNKYAS